MNRIKTAVEVRTTRALGGHLVVTAPDDWLLWLSPVLPGRAHDLTSPAFGRAGAPILADLAYQGGGPWLTTAPVERGVARLQSWRSGARTVGRSPRLTGDHQPLPHGLGLPRLGLKGPHPLSSGAFTLLQQPNHRRRSGTRDSAGAGPCPLTWGAGGGVRVVCGVRQLAWGVAASGLGYHSVMADSLRL